MMMTVAQRVDHLVMVLEGGNARRFASRTGITPQSVSCLRHGKYRIENFVDRILSAYPDVNPSWLTSGEGEPLFSEREKGEVLERLERIEKALARIEAMMAVAGR